jgi:acyl carrier protein
VAGARVREMLEEATQAEPGSLSSAQVLKELEGWDSLGVVMFIGLVLEHFALEISVHEIRDCVTVAELEARLAKLAEARR